MVNGMAICIAKQTKDKHKDIILAAIKQTIQIKPESEWKNEEDQKKEILDDIE